MNKQNELNFLTVNDSIDYEKIGFKCGLEIHQQLNVGKLFCSCNFDENDRITAQIKRKLTITKGELGTVDRAAAFEKEKDLDIYYKVPYNSACLVELDEEPPHEVNRNALYAAYQISLIFNMSIVDLIQFMRKIVIDGSNTSGFQRTALISLDGYVSTSKGKVNIATLCLEEDSCKIESKDGNIVVYDLTRLGVPLIEISTKPQIKDPQHAKETAETIGLLLRSSQYVKRGLGTIRQDLNISISGGNRIEIKGAQDLNNLDKILHYEVIRQLNLLRFKEFLNNKIRKEELKLEILDLTDIFRSTKSKIIQSALKRKGKVLGFKLKHFNGLLGLELLPNRRIGTEIADYAKQASGVKGLFHSDELPNYGITPEEVLSIKESLNCKEDDAFIIIADQEEKSRKALEAAFNRVLMFFDGVPSEVRQVLADNTTKFLRPMPGSARMYPETDIPYIISDYQNIEIPKLIREKIEDLRKIGLKEDEAKHIVKENKYELFIEILNKFNNLKPTFIYSVLISKIRELKRQFADLKESFLDENFFMELFNYLNEGKISKQSVDKIILEKARRGSVNFKEYLVLSKEEVEKYVRQIYNKNPNLTFKQAMGLVMKELRGKADGKVISQIVQQYFDSDRRK